jgi:hypothetical protein
MGIVMDRLGTQILERVYLGALHATCHQGGDDPDSGEVDAAMFLDSLYHLLVSTPFPDHDFQSHLHQAG